MAAIVQAGEDVILVRGRGWPEKMFGLVTGFIEAGEQPGDAAVREVREELGLDAEIVGLVGAYGFFAMNQLIVAYHLRVQGEVQLGEELEAFKRIRITKLRPWDFGTGAAVRDWLEARGSASG
ncbi:NUDIX domain-containing protein [Pendulispora albinea]|uniref:NUDIX domain-containing protein n=1 Tax=Pendulispora albinea TaxID=2741071 RepID=A0ABZ2M390_9BACT